MWPLRFLCWLLKSRFSLTVPSAGTSWGHGRAWDGFVRLGPGLFFAAVLVCVGYAGNAVAAGEPDTSNANLEAFGQVLPDVVIVRFKARESAALLSTRYTTDARENSVSLESADKALPEALPSTIVAFRPFAGVSESVESILQETAGLSSLLESADPISHKQQKKVLSALTKSIVEDEHGTAGLFYAQLAPGTDLQSVVKELAARDDVVYAEPSPVLELAQIPDDTFYPRMWNLSLINAPAAWDRVPNTLAGLKVCVVDTGVRKDHLELQGRVVFEKDVYTDNGDAYADTDPDNDDPQGHGTACAGIIASLRNNASSVSGIAPVTIIPVNGAILENGQYKITNYVEGIRWGVDHGARIISLSLGSYRLQATQAELDAVAYATQHGVLICAAAGNDDGNANIHFPSAIPDVISVGAIDDIGYRVAKPKWWWGSNYGSSVDICAPGQGRVGATRDSIITLGRKSNVDINTTFNGTSAATPQVAAVCALIMLANPKLTANEVWQVLRDTAKDQVGDPFEDVAGKDNYHGFGLVDADAAVQRALALK